MLRALNKNINNAFFNLNFSQREHLTIEAQGGQKNLPDKFLSVINYHFPKVALGVESIYWPTVCSKALRFLLLGFMWLYKKTVQAKTRTEYQVGLEVTQCERPHQNVNLQAAPLCDLPFHSLLDLSLSNAFFSLHFHFFR
jgi:hypothetical protein